jgi:hypothetical protein
MIHKTHGTATFQEFLSAMGDKALHRVDTFLYERFGTPSATLSEKEGSTEIDVCVECPNTVAVTTNGTVRRFVSLTFRIQSTRTAQTPAVDRTRFGSAGVTSTLLKLPTPEFDVRLTTVDVPGKPRGPIIVTRVSPAAEKKHE